MINLICWVSMGGGRGFWRVTWMGAWEVRGGKGLINWIDIILNCGVGEGC